MPVQGLDAVVGKLQLFLDEAKNERTEKAITAMLIEGGAAAASLTPVDTSNLINSQHKKTWKTGTGYAGAVYYQAPYAKWVHEMPGKLKGQPRYHFGRTREGKQFGGGSLNGNYWDPNAEPHFLKKGMEEMAQNAQTILAEAYKV